MNDRPRWVAPRDLALGVATLHEAYGGRRRRHLVKLLATPHLTVPGRRVLVGVAPYRADRGPARRIRDFAVNLGWFLAPRRGQGLPWLLRPANAPQWRVINLARSVRDPGAAAYTPALGSHVLGLADAAGVGLRAEAPKDRPRIGRVYERRGFVAVGEDDRDVHLVRPPAPGRRPAASRTWRRVLRTGRDDLASWRRRHGAAHGPFLDVGSGDSRLAADLRAEGIAAVALDPQFSLRPPAHSAAAVAGVAESLPFRDRVFAVVNAGFALQHTTDPAHALRELLRVARPDGTVVIHPLWSPRPAGYARLRGVDVRPGRRFPPRLRPSLTISVAEFDPAQLGRLACGVRPSTVPRTLGAWAMRVLIGARGTNSIGPGAVR